MTVRPLAAAALSVRVLAAAAGIVACHPEPARVTKRTPAAGAVDQPVTTAAAPPATLPFSTVLPTAYAPPPPPQVDAAAGFCAGVTTASSESHAPLAAYGAATGLSTRFADQCAGCHGYYGEGRDAFPPLPGALDAAAFARRVREGKGDMPAFAADEVDDATLAADAAALAALRAAPAKSALPEGFHDAPLPAAPPIDDAAYAAAMGAGLTAWRNPGETGACDACHGPDGIDLARIGYSAASIMRRAIGQGRTAGEARAIAAMITAQRRRFRIAEPCSPTFFRPLQPGGRPLAGDDALEAALKGRGIDLGTPPADAAQAKKLADALAALDPRLVPVAIPFNPWTADAFNGASLRSAAEWIPELAVEPRGADAEARWTEARNAYLAAPTDAHFWALYDLVEAQDAGRFGVAAGAVGERLSREKYRSVLLLSHMARNDARALPDLAAAADGNRFPIWEAAQVSSVLIRGCAEDGTNAGTPFPCWGYLPKFFAKMGVDRDALTGDAEALVLPWLTAGLLLDPALKFTENGKGQMFHWHQAFTGAHGDELPFHRVYFGALQLAHATPGCWEAKANGPAQWKANRIVSEDARAKAAVAAVDRMVQLLVGAKAGCGP